MGLALQDRQREKKGGGYNQSREKKYNKKNNIPTAGFIIRELLCLSSKFLLCAYVVLIMFNL